MTRIEDFTSQNRGGKGVKCYKIMEKTGNVIGVKAVNMDNEVMIINTEGIIIRMMCSDISVLGRVTSGVKLMNMDKHFSVASIAKVRESSNKTEEDMIKHLESELEEEEAETVDEKDAVEEKAVTEEKEAITEEKEATEEK